MAVVASDDDDFRSVMASVHRDGRRRRLQVHLNDGRWRRLRVAVAALLIGAYLALPFLAIAGRPALRVDIPHRQWTLAGQVFWPQDIYYLLLLLLILAVATLFTVAVAGRFFCGWLCPHSVLLETLFRPWERLVRGPSPRRTLDDAAGTGVLRRVAAWGGYALMSVVLASAATASFIGMEGLRWGLVPHPSSHPAALWFWGLSASLMLFDFGWLREQTCTIVCPYGRLQGVMLDPHSLMIAYDAHRGEPRGVPAGAGTGGDCIDCRRCVAVCPTGIDIRNGSQMECLHCAACCDACDTVMGRLGRSKGLIRYTSGIALAGGQRRTLRLRTLLYGSALLLLLGLAAWALLHRQVVEASRLRTIAGPVLVTGREGILVRQILPLALLNRSGEEQVCTLSLPADLGATILLSPSPIVMAPGQRQEVVPIIDLPRDRFAGHDLSTLLTLTATGATSLTRLDLDIQLHLP